MKKCLFVTGLIILLVLSATGCRTIFGRGHGPIDSFVLHPDMNPQLRQPVFGAIREAGDPKQIEVVVPPGTDRGSLIATVSMNSEATVTVLSSGKRVVQQNSATPNNFTAPVLYAIEVAGDDEPWQYQVVVREAETDARLAQVQVTPASGNVPAFSSESPSYTMEVPFATQEVRIEARARSRYLQGMSIGTSQVRGAAGAVTVPFAGVNRLDVPVETTAEDGETKVSYTVTLVRGEPDRNSQLRAVTVKDGVLSPGFSVNRTGYVATVPFAARQTVLSAVPQSEFSTVSLERIITTATGQSGRAQLLFQGDPRSGKGASFDFSDDRLVVGVVVTAQDGTFTRYQVEIRRADPDRNPALATLTVNGLPLSPAFVPDRLHYTVEVPSGTRQISVAAGPQSPVAQVAIEASGSGGQYVPASYGGNPAVGSGAVVDFSATDRLLLAVAVTAQDGTPLRYTLDIRRAAGAAGSPPATAPAVPPVAAAPVAAPPVMAAPVAAPPVTAPIAAPPVTSPPAAVRPPAAQPPAAAAPQPAAQQPKPQPAAQTPATIPPATPPPAVVSPPVAVQPPAQRPPAVQPPAVQPPAQQPPAVQPPAAQTPVVRPPAAPPTVTTVVRVQTRNLRLEAREAGELSKGKERITDQARITIRSYRTDQVLASQTVPIQVRQQGNSAPGITLAWASAGISVPADRFLEVEIAIPTSGGRFLHYTEAVAAAEEIVLEIPFLLLSGDPRVRWPETGTPVPVTASFFMIPPGQADKSGGQGVEFAANERGEQGVTLELTEPATGRKLFRDTVWTKPGVRRGQGIEIGSGVRIAEGAPVSYLLDAKMKNGRSWQTSGSTLVRTTRIRYEGGFHPALIFVLEQIR